MLSGDFIVNKAILLLHKLLSMVQCKRYCSVIDNISAVHIVLGHIVDYVFYYYCYFQLSLLMATCPVYL